MLNAGIGAPHVPQHEWQIGITGIKLIGVAARTQAERDAQARVREFLMLLKMAVS